MAMPDTASFTSLEGVPTTQSTFIERTMSEDQVETDGEKASDVDSKDEPIPRKPIDNFEELSDKIDAVFGRQEKWDVTKTCLTGLLDSLDLSTSEINKVKADISPIKLL
jgi:hypothetical protein